MRWIGISLGFLGLVMILPGCSSDKCNPSNCQFFCEDHGDRYGTCQDNGDCACTNDPPPGGDCPPTCPAGYTLGGERCTLSCGDCASGTECINGVCIPPAGPYPGAPCTTAGDCPGDSTCEEMPMLYAPGTRWCTDPCADDGDCPTGGICYHGMCTRPCNPRFSDACGNSDLACYTPSDVTTGVCMPRCNLFDEGLGDICVLFSGGSCESTGTCSDATGNACTPGVRTCHAGYVLECGSDASSLLCIEQCLDGSSCVDGACVP